jgi:AraC-like DNA-binding protein
MRDALLPQLAFGARTALIDTTVYGMQDRLRLLANGMQEYDALTPPKLFLHQSSFTNINGLVVGSTSSTATQVKIKKVGSAMLMVPFSGQGHYLIMDEKLTWQKSHVAVLLPDQAFEGASSSRSSLVILIDPIQLDFVVKSIIGSQSNTSPQIDLSRPQEISLQYGRINFEAIFKQLSILIDQFSLHAGFLDRSGLDDTIYRSIAMMFRPDLLSDEHKDSVKLPFDRDLLDRACQYIQSKLSQPITLSNLEHISGMSRRSLQSAFHKRYDCSPMQWIRFRRLEQARSTLENSTAQTSVTVTAMECGFSNASIFSNYYKARFGELPSKVLAKRRNAIDHS